MFRLHVAHQHEIYLLKKTTTPEGVTKYRDTEESLDLEKRIVHLPKLTSALHGSVVQQILINRYLFACYKPSTKSNITRNNLDIIWIFTRITYHFTGGR